MLRGLLAVLVLVVSGGGAAQAQNFPVTIAHAYGEATIQEAPLRVVAIGSSSAEAAIALGVVPVGMPSAPSSGHEGEFVPWVADAVAALGAPLPTILDNGVDVPIEQVAALKPDLILAVYSGITDAEYRALSAIAPTVAFPETAWTASWQQVIEITGAALGKPEAASALVADLTHYIADEGAARPVLAGKSFVTLLDYNDSLAVHSTSDPRVKMLEDAGMLAAAKPAEAGVTDGFWYPLSYENFEAIPADIIIAFLWTQDGGASFLAKPFTDMGQWKADGALVVMDDELLNMAVVPGDALSLRWGLPRYFDLLATAAANVEKVTK